MVCDVCNDDLNAFNNREYHLASIGGGLWIVRINFIRPSHGGLFFAAQFFKLIETYLSKLSFIKIPIKIPRSWTREVFRLLQIVPIPNSFLTINVRNTIAILRYLSGHQGFLRFPAEINHWDKTGQSQLAAVREVQIPPFVPGPNHLAVPLFHAVNSYQILPTTLPDHPVSAPTVCCA